MVIYNIQSNGPSNQLVIELLNDSVFVEPSSVAYISGHVQLDASVKGFKNKFKAYFIGKKYFKPCFTGTGKIYLKATLGSYHKFSIKEDEKLIIGPNAFIACRDSIQLIPIVSASVANFLSGLPTISTLVRGVGNVVVHMPGPVVQTELKDDKFVAYSSDIAAYSQDLKVTREQAGKGWLSIASKMVQVYRGSGNLYFTPNPNKDSKAKKE